MVANHQISRRRELHDWYNIANGGTIKNEQILNEYNSLYNGNLIEGESWGEVQKTLKQGLV